MRKKRFATILILRQSIAFISTINFLFFAGLLGVAEIGNYAVIFSIFSITQVLQDYNLYSRLISKSSSFSNSEVTGVFLASMIRSSFCILLFCVVVYVLSEIDSKTFVFEIKSVIVFCVIILCNAARSPSYILIEKDDRYKLAVRTEFIAFLLGSLLSIYMVYTTRSHFYIAFPLFVSSVIQLVLSYIYFPWFPSFEKKALIEGDLRSVSSLTLSSSIAAVSWKLDEILLASLLGKSSVAGVFLASKFSTVPLADVSKSLLRTILPDLNRIFDCPVRYDSLLSRYLLVMSFFVSLFLPFVSIFLLAKFGDKYANIDLMVLIFGFSLSLQSYSVALRQYIAFKRKENIWMWREFVVGLYRIPLLIIFVIYFGLVGYMAFRCLCAFINSLIDFNVLKRSGFSVEKPLFFKSFVSSFLLLGYSFFSYIFLSDDLVTFIIVLFISTAVFFLVLYKKDFSFD